MRRGNTRGGKYQRFTEERKFSGRNQISEQGSSNFMQSSQKQTLGSKNRRNNLHFQMEQKSKLEDLENMRFLSQEEKKQLKELELQLSCLEEPRPAKDEFQLFSNKKFNEKQKEFPHLSSEKIRNYLKTLWRELSSEDKEIYSNMAKEELEERKEKMNDLFKRRQELSEEIHKLKYGEEVQQILKPSGKLKFLSAFRVYRRVNINRVKEAFPDMENKGRHDIIKQMWKNVSESERFIYVLKSRADKERALYQLKLQSILESAKAHTLSGHYLSEEEKERLQEDMEEMQRELKGGFETEDGGDSEQEL